MLRAFLLVVLSVVLPLVIGACDTAGPDAPDDAGPSDGGDRAAVVRSPPQV